MRVRTSNGRDGGFIIIVRGGVNITVRLSVYYIHGEGCNVTYMRKGAPCVYFRRDTG